MPDAGGCSIAPSAADRLQYEYHRRTSHGAQNRVAMAVSGLMMAHQIVVIAVNEVKRKGLVASAQSQEWQSGFGVLFFLLSRVRFK